MDDTEVLVAFVVARLAEEQAQVEKVYGFWRDDGNGNIVDTSYASCIAVGPGGKGIDDASREHILRYGPERMLREVGAKRRILATHRFACRFAAANEGAEREIWEKIASALRQCVLDLAGAWSDHPDCKSAWKPVFASAISIDPSSRSVNSQGGDASRTGEPSGATIHTAVLPDWASSGPSSSGSGPQ